MTPAELRTLADALDDVTPAPFGDVLAARRTLQDAAEALRALTSASAAKDEEIAKLRASLQKVAEHDGERGEFTDDDIFERKPSPQDIARAVLKGSNG